METAGETNLRGTPRNSRGYLIALRAFANEVSALCAPFSILVDKMESAQFTWRQLLRKFPGLAGCA